MRFVLPLVAALLPVVIAPGILFYFDVTPKIAIVLIGTAAALVIWKGGLPLASRRNRVFLLLLAASAISLLCSTLFSTGLALSLNGGTWRRYGLVTQISLLLFAVLVASDCAADPHRVSAYGKAIVAGGIPVALYAVAQYFGWDPWLSPQAYHAGEDSWLIVRPPSTMGHAGYLATYLLFVVFASIGLWRQGVWRAASFAAAVLASTAIVMSGTRAALAGLVAGGLVVVWLARPPRLLRYAAAAVLLAAVLYWSPAGRGLRNRATWIANEPLGGARPLLWRDSLAMSVHRLALGYGPETFIREFPRYQSIALSHAYPDFLHESPHNIFLDALAAQGLPGLLALAALCAWGVFAARRSPWLLGAIVAVIVAQSFTSFVASTAFFFYLALALAIEPCVCRAVPLARVAAWCCALLLIGWSCRLLVADSALECADIALQRGNLAAAEAAHRTVVRWSLPGAGPELFCSRRFLGYARSARNFPDKAQAVQDAVRAALAAVHDTDQLSNAWYNLAMFLSLTNSPRDVESSLRQAILAAPNWYKPHWVLAQLLIAQNRLEDARRESEISIRCNGTAPEVLHTLEKIRASQGQ